jgi:hypothetical protein
MSLQRTLNATAVTTFAVAVAMISFAAWAEAVPVSSSGTIDFTALAVAGVGGIFSVLSTVALALINKYVKDETARQVLNAAVTNSLGALQKASQDAITAAAPQINLPEQLKQFAPAVRYVMEHAGPEAERFGITAPKIADKISARLGLANVEHNLAVTANATPAVAGPLAPVQEREAR